MVYYLLLSCNSLILKLHLTTNITGCTFISILKLCEKHQCSQIVEFMLQLLNKPLHCTLISTQTFCMCSGVEQRYIYLVHTGLYKYYTLPLNPLLLPDIITHCSLGNSLSVVRFNVESTCKLKFAILEINFKLNLHLNFDLNQFTAALAV